MHFTFTFDILGHLAAFCNHSYTHSHTDSGVNHARQSHHAKACRDPNPVRVRVRVRDNSTQEEPGIELVDLFFLLSYCHP